MTDPVTTGQLSIGGVVFMTLAWAAIAFMAIYCYVKVHGTRNRRR